MRELELTKSQQTSLAGKRSIPEAEQLIIRSSSTPTDTDVRSALKLRYLADFTLRPKNCKTIENI